MNQRTTPSTVAASSATQTQLTEVEAAAKEFCEKILSVFKDYLPEQPLDQHTDAIVPESEQPLDQRSDATVPESEQSRGQNTDTTDAESEQSLGQNTDTTDPESFNQPFGPLTEAQAAAQAAAQEFLKGTKHNHCRRLHIAASKGDWETAKSFIKDDPSALTARITFESLTLLTVAARAGQWKFVRKLLEDLPSYSLEAQDVYGQTALHFVSMGGSLKTAKALTGKNSTLPHIPDDKGRFPCFISFRNKKLVWYLLLLTMDKHSALPFTPGRSAGLLRMLILAGYYDITLYMLRRYPQLAILKISDKPSQLLFWLSNQFQSGQSNLRFWPKWIYKFIHVEVTCVPPHSIFIDVEDIHRNAGDFPDMAASVQPSSILTKVLKGLNRLLWKAIEQLAPPLKQVRQEKSKQAYVVKIVECVCENLIAESMTYEQILEFFNRPSPVLPLAASRGNVEIISTCLQHFPDLIFIGKENDHNGMNLLHVAIENRQATLFNFIKKMPTIAQLLCGGNAAEARKALYLAAELAPSPQLLSIPGEAFQMQSELQWFKEVEKITNPAVRELALPNEKELTAKQVFMKEHKDIAQKGEKWMRDTANSGMIVTTLITTVVLAAAFTVPGGNNDQGIPIFLHKPSFLIFVVSDALALFSSVTSLLMFLSILTARYEVEDFLHALPSRIIIGLGSLFFALATMMVAFGATLFILLSEKWQWAYIPIILLASIPVTIFAWQQLPLFISMIKSTYGSGIFRS